MCLKEWVELKYLKGQGVMEKYKTSEENSGSQTQWDVVAGLGAVQGRGFCRPWEGGEAAESGETSQIMGGRAPLLCCVGWKKKSENSSFCSSPWKKVPSLKTWNKYFSLMQHWPAWAQQSGSSTPMWWLQWHQQRSHHIICLCERPWADSCVPFVHLVEGSRVHSLVRPTAWPSAAPYNVAWQVGIWLGQPSITAICYPTPWWRNRMAFFKIPRNSKSCDFLCLLKTNDFQRYFHKSKNQQAVNVNQHPLRYCWVKSRPQNIGVDDSLSRTEA